MTDNELSPLSSEPGHEPAAPARKRPKPGERRVQILEALATMLEQPGSERITTAALAVQVVLQGVRLGGAGFAGPYP